MKIEVAKMERMSQTGSSLLRLIQNSHTPTLDLLMRESIQNSLDASRNEGDPVKFGVDITRFNNDQVASYFEGIDDKLVERYPNENTAIVLRDSNTEGLTGPIHQDYVENNRYGNLLKLVYEISMPQERKEAGGSWGLGKTVYFRIGIGLVIYYSRIRLDDGTYESRLAACLIEDESSDDAMIPVIDNNRRGIAWWGEEHREDSTRPVIDEEYISKFLKDFNVRAYEGEETGTTIIIPYINKDRLLIKPEKEDEFSHIPNWYNNINQYLNLAIQRWYAPRIDNPNYAYGSYLKPIVGDKEITAARMAPLFRVIRGLYNFAETGEKDPFIDNKNLKKEEALVYRDMESNVAGIVSFIKLSEEELDMLPPNNDYSPYDYIGENSYKHNEKNAPIIAYVRKPGMIINYELDSKWTKDINGTDKDEYIIGLFIPASDNVLKEQQISLDEYLRQGEKADHSSWEDTPTESRRVTIVDRIQKRTSQAIRNAFNVKPEKIEGSRSNALSRAIAKKILPPIGFGKAPSTPTTKQRTTDSDQKPRTKKSSYKITDTKQKGDQVILSIEVTPKKDNTLTIETLVQAEGTRRIRGNDWEDDIRTRFPIGIKDTEVVNDNDVHIKEYKTIQHQVVNAVKISTQETEEPYLLELTLQMTERLIQPDIKFTFSHEVINNE